MPPALEVHAAGRGARRAEHRDRAAQLGEQAEALDELGLDAQHPPRVGVHPVTGPAPVQQALIGGGARDLLPAQRGRALAAQPTARLGMQAHGP